MNHPINPLNDEGLNALNDYLTNLSTGLDDLRQQLRSMIEVIPARQYDEVRAYVGAIAAAHEQTCELLYGDRALLVGEGLVTSPVKEVPFTPGIGETGAAFDEALHHAVADHAPNRIPDRIAHQLMRDSTIVSRVSDLDVTIETPEGERLHMIREFPYNVNQWMVTSLDTGWWCQSCGATGRETGVDISDHCCPRGIVISDAVAQARTIDGGDR